MADVADRAAAAQSAAERLEAKLTQPGFGAEDASEFLDELRAVIDTHVATRADELRAPGWDASNCSGLAQAEQETRAELREANRRRAEGARLGVPMGCLGDHAQHPRGGAVAPPAGSLGVLPRRHS